MVVSFSAGGHRLQSVKHSSFSRHTRHTRHFVGVKHSSPNLFLKAHQTHQTLCGTLPRLSVLRIASGYVSMGIVQSCISGSTYVIVAMDMEMGCKSGWPEFLRDAALLPN